jgi:predicted enzyme related to lactoylglutathione lyase
MVEMKQYSPGTFCWIDLGTSDPAGAKKFYSELFGWDMVDEPAGEAGTYTMARRRGLDVGGMYELSAEMKSQGVPPNWLSYVSVEDADGAAAKATSLGGKVVMGPMDVMGEGKMAVVQDPTGAVFAMWQPIKHCGARLVNEDGSLCWNELMTKDLKSAGKFYSTLLGWASKEEDMSTGKYTMFMNGERPAAGMMEITSEMGFVPPHWSVYFAVADCDATIAKATALGGKVVVPATDIPGAGRFACLQDPQGAVFNIIKMDQPASP